MTWLDWLIAAVFAFLIYRGYKKGFVQQLFDLLGSIFALILAFGFYEKVGKYIAGVLHFSIPLSNIIGFIFIVVGVSGTVSFIGKRWNKVNQDEPVTLVDRGIGALFGGVKATIILVALLMIALAVPWDFIHEPIEVSGFANDLLRLAPQFYMLQDRLLPSNVPRLVVSPEGLQWRLIKEEKLEGATCVACGAKVHFRGFVKKGLLYYPQCYCPNCRRTSDGCLTFEGYHMLNGACPYVRLGSLGTTDCKVWPNLEPTTIKGKCPVCGRTQ